MVRPIPLLLAVACSRVPKAEPPDCGSTHREVALDEPIGDAGFTAEQVLAFVEGRLEQEGRDGDEDPVGVTVEAELAGRVLACERFETMFTPLASTGEAFSGTADRVDLELEIHIATDDGAWDSTTTAFASSSWDGTSASAHFEVEAPELAQVEVGWTGDGTFGEVDSEVDFRTLVSW